MTPEPSPLSAGPQYEPFIADEKAEQATPETNQSPKGVEYHETVFIPVRDPHWIDELAEAQTQRLSQERNGRDFSAANLNENCIRSIRI